jgi:hypothetical protein
LFLPTLKGLCATNDVSGAESFAGVSGDEAFLAVVVH